MSIIDGVVHNGSEKMTEGPRRMEEARTILDWAETRLELVKWVRPFESWH